MEKRKYHYEYAAYTNNLAWGRVKISQSDNSSVLQFDAQNAGMGCFDIVKVRVYDN